MQQIVLPNGKPKQDIDVNNTQQFNRVQEFDKVYFNWIPHIVAAVFTSGISLIYTFYIRDKKKKLAKRLGIDR